MILDNHIVTFRVVKKVTERKTQLSEIKLLCSIFLNMSADGAVYEAIEFNGSLVKDYSISGRMVICSMAVDPAGNMRLLHSKRLVALVIASSFARIIFRNAINLGLPVLTCKKSPEVATEGGNISVNLSTGEIYNIDRDVESQGELLLNFVLNIIENGGIKNRLKKYMVTTIENSSVFARY